MCLQALHCLINNHSGNLTLAVERWTSTVAAVDGCAKPHVVRHWTSQEWRGVVSKEI